IFRGDVKSLGVELLLPDRLKCSEPDMQRNVRDLGAGSAASIQDLRRKVKSGRRRRGGTGLARKYGLVSVAIVRSIRALDIWRQRHVANLVEQREDIALPAEVHRSLAVLVAADNLSLRTVEL